MTSESSPRDGLCLNGQCGTCTDCVPVPVDPFDRVITEIVALNRSKRSDYSGGRGPWANFEDAAYQVGCTPAQVIEMHIANKQSRLRSLNTNGRTPNHEAKRDTILDRAVYSIIALALYDETHADD